jgi:hypothetical protein
MRKPTVLLLASVVAVAGWIVLTFVLDLRSGWTHVALVIGVLLAVVRRGRSATGTTVNVSCAVTRAADLEHPATTRVPVALIERATAERGPGFGAVVKTVANTGRQTKPKPLAALGGSVMGLVALY